MRKFVFTLFCASLVFCALTSTWRAAPVFADAAAEIAMELSTGKVLRENNADTKLPMASTTKIMTAILIIEDCDLDEEITVPANAVGVEGSSIYLKKEEVIDVRDLIYGLMLRSGNDSAAALAIHHSGSLEKFVNAMNDKAKSLGAVHTNFKNPSGLPDADHYTTARDLCTIACYAMKNPEFKKIVSTRNYRGKYRSFSNKNKMLANYDGANGVKTGYTLKAGRCLVSSAEREGMDVVTAVLNCPDMYERSAALLDSCFSEYKLICLEENRRFMCNKVLCKTDESSSFVTKSSVEPRIQVTPINGMTKIKTGDKVGELEIYAEKDLIFKTNLYSIMDR